MKWKKMGRIYQPDGSLSWGRTHAANPVAEPVEGDLFRVYFSTRDEQNRSSVGFVEIDLRRPCTVLHVATEPILGPGDIGMPDDNGVSIGCIARVKGKRHLYYMGWNLSVTVPWRNTIGLAISESKDHPFVRYSRFPVVGLDETDPYTISYPWVLEEKGIYKMWYGSNLAWGAQKSDMRHVLKYAESDDGLVWRKSNRVVLDLRGPEECAICKPCVLKEQGLYKLWFCCRGEKYRIGYAESKDGLVWERMDHAVGISVSESGWDSEAVAYPSVFDHQGARYLLYSGNSYGRGGIGIAVLE